MDFEPLKVLIGDLLSGDRHRQRRAVYEHVSEDVHCSHILGTANGRDALYGIYCLCSTEWEYKVRQAHAALSGHGRRA